MKDQRADEKDEIEIVTQQLNSQRVQATMFD
jgi:hypothetical protein